MFQLRYRKTVPIKNFGVVAVALYVEKPRPSLVQQTDHSATLYPQSLNALT